MKGDDADHIPGFVPDFASGGFVRDIVPEIPEALSCRYRLFLPRYQVHFRVQVEAEEMQAADGAGKAC